MDAEAPLPLSLPCDADGFIRRRCPSCGGEFKWKLKHSQRHERVATVATRNQRGTWGEFLALLKTIRPPGAPEVRYHCPYCSQCADAEDFVTPDQQEMLLTFAGHEVFTPGLATFAAGLARAEGRSETLPLSSQPELSDMRLVTFACHPDEPIKVADEWNRSLHSDISPPRHTGTHGYTCLPEHTEGHSCTFVCRRIGPLEPRGRARSWARRAYQSD